MLSVFYVHNSLKTEPCYSDTPMQLLPGNNLGRLAHTPVMVTSACLKRLYMKQNTKKIKIKYTLKIQLNI